MFHVLAIYHICCQPQVSGVNVPPIKLDSFAHCVMTSGGRMSDSGAETNLTLDDDSRLRCCFNFDSFCCLIWWLVVTPASSVRRACRDQRHFNSAALQRKDKSNDGTAAKDSVGRQWKPRRYRSLRPWNVGILSLASCGCVGVFIRLYAF